MDRNIEISIERTTRVAAERGVDTLDLYRSEYRSVLDIMVGRGYGTAATLNAEARRYATRFYGPCPDDGMAAAAWWTLGLYCVQGEKEYGDPDLD